MTHPRVLAVLAAAVSVALAAAPAGAWTPPRTIGTAPPAFHELNLAFNARGDTLLLGSSGSDVVSAVRPGGGRFGALRRARTSEFVSFRDPPLLDLDRTGLLLGDWDDPVAELRTANHPECCERAAAARLGRHGGVGEPVGLTPHGEEGYVVGMTTDERGAAGIVLRSGDSWSFVTRTRHGRLGAPVPVAQPEEGELAAVTVRPDRKGWAFWLDRIQGNLHDTRVRSDGSLSGAGTLFYVTGGDRIVHVFFVHGRKGHVWMLARIRDTEGVERVWATPLDANGRWGINRLLPSADPAAVTAVDDEGALHVAWADEGVLRTASDIPNLRFGRVRTVARGRGLADVAMAAGPRGRNAFAWTTQPARGTTELWASSGHRTRVGKPVRLERLERFASFGDVALGISRDSEAVLGWYESGVERPMRFRYGVQRLP